MPTVRYYEEQISCATAIKGPDYVRLYDENGACISSFDGVKDFSVFSIEGGVWYAPVSADPPVTAVSSTKVGKDTISVTTATPWRAATGQELRFKSPCDSLGITTLRIDGVNYTLVDTLRNQLSTCQSAFSTDSFVDVLLNVQDKTAYAINPANNTYIDGQLKAAAKVVVSMNEPSASDNIAAGYSIGAMWLRPSYTLTNLVYALEASSITPSACTINKSKQTFTVAGNGDDMVLSVECTLPSQEGWLYAKVSVDETAASASVTIGDHTAQLTPGSTNSICIEYTGNTATFSAKYATANAESSGVVTIENFTVLDKAAVMESGVYANSDITTDTLLLQCSMYAPFNELVLAAHLWQHCKDGVWELIYGITSDTSKRFGLGSSAGIADALTMLSKSFYIPSYNAFIAAQSDDSVAAALGKNNSDICWVGKALVKYEQYKNPSASGIDGLLVVPTVDDLFASIDALIALSKAPNARALLEANSFTRDRFTAAMPESTYCSLMAGLMGVPKYTDIVTYEQLVQCLNSDTASALSVYPGYTDQHEAGIQTVFFSTYNAESIFASQQLVDVCLDIPAYAKYIDNNDNFKSAANASPLKTNWSTSSNASTINVTSKKCFILSGSIGGGTVGTNIYANIKTGMFSDTIASTSAANYLGWSGFRAMKNIVFNRTYYHSPYGHSATFIPHS